MTVHYQKQGLEVLNALSEDSLFILEALEKLIDGTCCSQDDGKICTWDLLPRINEALQEHIEFEEKWLFPSLSKEEESLHKNQHKNLQKLLAEASWELECGYGDQFKHLARKLHAAFSTHHNSDKAAAPVLPYECGESCVRDSNLKKIKKRTLSPWKREKAS